MAKISSRVSVNVADDDRETPQQEMEKWDGYYVIVNKKIKEKLPSNYIRTTKYTVWSFLPLNLYSQFRRFYNIYFLAAALIAVSMPEASPISPFTSVTPLVVVVLVTMVKDIFEDYLRLKADRAANNIECTVLRPNGERVDVKSKDIRPGDLIEVKRDMPFPADMVLLASTHMEEGRCFVETAQLDGESNLKRRLACFDADNSGTQDYQTLVTSLQEGYGRIDCEKPNPHLYRFEGRIDWVAGDESLMFALKPEHLLLRGAVLKNTDKILGAAVYVGNESKIMKNTVKSSLKFSTMEGRLNALVVAIFLFNVLVLVLSSVFSGIWQDWTGIDSWYLDWNLTGVEVSFYHAATYFVLWTYLIPISLFVSIEMVRLSQMFFMKWDAGMVAVVDGVEVPMNPNSSNLNEDLGKIDHIFSDKTGTVTQNIMRLVAWVGDDFEFSEESVQSEGALLKSHRHDTHEQADAAHRVAMLAAVCNTVTPEVKNGKIFYDGDSPDELALMESLRLNDITLVDRTNTTITLKGEMMEGGEEQWTIHSVLTFSSARKRMSVVASRQGSSELTLFTKGADSVVLELLRDKTGEDAKRIIERIDEYARRGLRTLILGQRSISREEFDAYHKRFLAADASIGHREARLAEAFASIEHDFELVGCTAVEDKLQDQVPETIAYILKAGINFWLLTGDKMETAISVGVSCRLLESADEVVRIAHAETLEECRQAFESARAKLSPRRGFVVDGSSLVHALTDELFPIMLEFASASKSVICCRMSPQQKALVVEGVRRLQNKVTLAIGDGANDVGMILKADVGVGVMGREGSQVARAADYAIGEFKLLQRLVCVIGRHSHLRLAELINYSFYKNIAFIIVVFWFGFYSGWSGKSIYQDTLMACFNIIFTSLPPIMVGLFERDVDDTVINKHPGLYREVRGGIYFNLRNTSKWVITGLVHSLLAYFLSAGAFGLFDESMADFPSMSLYFSTLLLFVVTGRMILNIRTWTWPMYASIILSVIGYFSLMFIVLSIGGMYIGTAPILFGSPIYYFTFFVVFGATFLSDMFVMYLQRTYWPYDWQVMQELERLGVDNESKPLLQ